MNNGFSRNESRGFKAGLDYFINNKRTLGILINGNMGDNNNRTDSKTPIVYKPTGETNRILTANNRNDADRARDIIKRDITNIFL